MSEQNTSQAEYVVTARKWRPQNFDQLVGQAHISTTLTNAINNNRIHHAYLFTGPRGVGKTTSARIYARQVIAHGIKEKTGDIVSPDDVNELDIIEIDGASNNSVDDIRSLRENSKYLPTQGKYKIYIIDEVHMLSTAAFNALLKTLEEPPPHLLFVFATTEPHKIPATITSRCQRFDFKRMSIADISGQLKKIASAENITVEEEALIAIAKKADGSMRDSQSIFDQVVAFCGQDVKYSDMVDALNLIDEGFYFQISDAVFAQNIAEMFELTGQIMEKGYDLRETLMGLLEHFRNILNMKVSNNSQFIDSSENYIQKYKEDAKKFSEKDLLRIMTAIVNAEKDIKVTTQPRIRFELLLSSLTKMNSTLDIGELIKEIKSLKANNFQVDNSQSSEQKKNSNIAEKQVNSKYSNPVDSSSLASSKGSKSPNVYQDASVLNKIDEIRSTKITTPPYESSSDKKANKKDVISAEKLEAGWQEFLNTYGKMSQGLNFLSQTKVDFLNGSLIFHPQNDFISETLENKKGILSNFLEQHYSAKIQIKIGKPETILITTPEANITKKPAVKRKSNELSEVENYLIEHFNAEEV